MKNIWIIGLGGIGNAIKNKMESKGDKVTVFSRTSRNSFDITSEEQVDDYVKYSGSLPDIVIITAGVLYDDNFMPEKSIRSVSQKWLEESLNINVLPTLFFAKAITKRLKYSDDICFASFSARVSSISDNRLGGWHSYRMTKSMLNMLIKNIAIEWQQKSPGSIIFGYHPGTVDTYLSKPFQASLNKENLFTVEQAAEYFIDCLSTINLDSSGKIYDWQKTEIMP